MNYIVYLGILPLFIAALIAVLWACWYLTLVLARRVHVGAAMLLLLYVTEAIFISLPGIHLTLFLYPQDIVLSLLGVAGLFRLFWLRGLGGRRMLLGVVLFLFLLSIGRGLVAYGPKLAGNEARSDFWFMAGLAYFASFHYDKEVSERMLLYWMRAAIALIALVVFRWMAMVLHLGIAAQWSELEVGFPMRVLTCGSAFFLLVSALISAHLILAGQATRQQRWVLYLGAPIAVLLQHRTVWVCALIAVLLFVTYTPRLPKQLVVGGLAILLFAGLFGTIFVAGRGIDVQRSFVGAAQNSDDWDWRVEGWASLWQSHFNDPVSVLVGEPYGAGFARYINGQLIDVICHNAYLQMALRIGIVGLLCFVALYISCLWAVHRARGGGAELLVPGQTFWRTWVVMSLAYCISYSPNYDQSLLFGMLISLSSHAARVRIDDWSAVRIQTPQHSLGISS